MGGSRRVFCGRYELLERIGVGGQAEVFRARLPGPGGFEKIVVIKRILPAQAEDQLAVQMLVEEAKIAGAANHDNIAQVFELGATDDGKLFIVFEYIDGVDLGQLIGAAKRKGELPMWLAVHIYCEVLEALAFLHEMRDASGRRLEVVHRDVTPSNIFISQFGKVKLGDFGIAHFAGKAATTRAGQLKGKLQFMSPEQLSSRALDQRADLFAVGVGLWECLTLEPLFSGTDPEVMMQICEGVRPRVFELAPRVPPALDSIVARAVAVDRDLRFRDALEMQAALLDVLHEMRPSIRRGEVRRALDQVLRGRDVEHIQTQPDDDDTEWIAEDTVRSAPAKPVEAGPTVLEGSTTDRGLKVAPHILASAKMEDAARGRREIAPEELFALRAQFRSESRPQSPRPAPAAEPAEPTSPMFWLRGSPSGPVSQYDWNGALERMREASFDGRSLAISADGRRWMDLAELSRLAGLDLIAGTADAPSNVTVVSNLDQCSIVAAIGILARDRHTGTMAIARTQPVTGEWYEINIVDGQPTRVATNVDDMQLPTLLVREGIVSADRLPKLMQQVVRDQRPLGELVESELGTTFGRATFLSARLGALLGWTGADYTFSVDYGTRVDPPFARTLLAPILWIIERTFSLEQLLALTQDRANRRFKPDERLSAVLDDMELDARVRALADRLASGRTIAESIEADPRSTKMLASLAYMLSECELLV